MLLRRHVQAAWRQARRGRGAGVVMAAARSAPVVLDTRFGSAGAPLDAVVVLNYKLPAATLALLRLAPWRVCADGGANRLYDAAPRWLPSAPSADAARLELAPHVVVGDLDSVRPDVLAFFRDVGGAAVVDLGHDQDSTDLTKCVRHVVDRGAGTGGWVVAVGALEGRLDHELSNLSTLHAFQDTRLALHGCHSLALLVPPGRSVVRPDRAKEGPVCGLVACGRPVVASSEGLKWDLDGTRLAFGELQSTSNELVAEEVSIEADGPLLWTTSLGGGGEAP